MRRLHPGSESHAVSINLLTQSNIGSCGGRSQDCEAGAADPANEIGFRITCFRPMASNLAVERLRNDQSLARTWQRLEEPRQQARRLPLEDGSAGHTLLHKRDCI